MTKLGLLLVSYMLCSSVAAIPSIPEIPALPIITSPNHTYHVNNQLGNDSFNRGTKANPWKSFKFAVGKLRAGDSLIVHGTDTAYAMDWTSLVHSGDERRWITIEGKNGANGERVVFTGRLSFGDKGRLSVSYVYLNNILFQGGGGGGLNVYVTGGSHHLVFQGVEVDCKSSPSNRRGLWTENGVRFIWFEDMFVHHCGYKRNPPEEPPPPEWKSPTDCGGICVKGDKVDNVVFLNVTVTDNVGDGVGGGSKKSYGRSYYKNCLSERNTGDGFDPGGAFTVIINSISRNNGGHQGAGFKFWSKESWLVNSVAYNNYAAGVVVKPKHDGVSHAYILNNTFAMNKIDRYGGQIATSPRHPANGKLHFYILNNIFHTLNSSAIVIQNIGSQVIKNEGHNYYFFTSDVSRDPHWTYVHAIHYRNGNDKVLRSYSFPEMDDNGKWSADTGNGAGNIGEIETADKLNPGFIDLGSGDLRLSEESLAIDGGIDLGIKFDIDGVSVPFGKAPDMGAYEYTKL